ncbi:MAG: protease modulator HflC [Candidatus Omnitrophica bacterium]|nr:protease modulator HflC [Candidatus Omnitrophota bacterium]
MKNKPSIYIGSIFVLLVIFFVGGGPFYILYEGQQAVITQFGDPIGNAVVDAGLHFKLPFIQKTNYFEKRILEWDGYPTQIPTKDKKYIWVDTTARWRINDPLRFFQSVYDERGAQARLDDIVDSAVRDAVTGQNLIELVRSSNRLVDELEDGTHEQEFIEEGALDKISFGREKIRLEIVQRARVLAPQYGIELIDVRIKRVDYVEEVRVKVYERMIAERKRAAEEYRSEGRGIRADIEGRTEKELKQVLSEAYKEAQTIKGKADAEATKIYAEAYNKDPDFYTFLKTLETYQHTVDAHTTLILSTDAEYFRYLKSSQP